MPIDLSNSEHKSAFPRRESRPGCCPVTSSRQGGRRECRGRRAPAASRATKKAHEHSHHRYNAIIRHSLRDAFTGSFVLSPPIPLSSPHPPPTHTIPPTSPHP